MLYIVPENVLQLSHKDIVTTTEPILVGIVLVVPVNMMVDNLIS